MGNESSETLTQGKTDEVNISCGIVIIILDFLMLLCWLSLSLITKVLPILAIMVDLYLLYITLQTKNAAQKTT